MVVLNVLVGIGSVIWIHETIERLLPFLPIFYHLTYLVVHKNQTIESAKGGLLSFLSVLAPGLEMARSAVLASKLGKVPARELGGARLIGNARTYGPGGKCVFVKPMLYYHSYLQRGRCLN